MPRLPPSLYRCARQVDPLLPLLLPVCRTVESAEQELRWIRAELPRDEWHHACRKRSMHYPLQYILKSQPFGDLDIECRPGVLIPRWETEEWCFQLSKKLRHKPNLRVLDLCTGTGCIPLLLKQQNPTWEVSGLDISPLAVDLARANGERNQLDVTFRHGDVFHPQEVHVDLVTSNPPYIVDINGASLSTRLFEPKLALQGDTEFYAALVPWLRHARYFVFEVGTLQQCYTVQEMLKGEWRTEVTYDSNGQVRTVSGERL